MKKNLYFVWIILIFLPIGLYIPAENPLLIKTLANTREVISAWLFDRPFLEKVLVDPFSDQASSKDVLSIQSEPNLVINLYGLLEFSLRTNLPATNPYDPNDIDLRVSFSAPSGKEVQVGAFWYQDFDPKTHKTTGEPGWKVRFTPDEVGEWLAVAYAPALGLHSMPVSFTVKPSNKDGFIRVNPKNSHYLAFDDGDFFFPIGVNMAWWDGDSDPVRRYHQWLDDFTANGGNTIRVWMASWSFGIEWRDTGLGNYDRRQYEAWLLDQLFGLADEHGVKIILVLINHGAFSLEANSEWENNPYNARLGGPLTRPEQFVSDPIAKAYFRQRLGYIINRWGYSPDLLAWEWFNEVNLTPISDADLVPWLKDMTAFLDERDVNQHLTTSSFAMRVQSAIWKQAGLDIVQEHEYSSQINEKLYDLADRAGQEFQELAASVPPKPILIGEFGYSAQNYGDDIEKSGIHLHNGLWATTFSGYAGTGMYWWWDIYIDANNLWRQFKGLANFLDGEDLAEYQPFTPPQIVDAKAIPAPVVGLGLKSEKTLLWLRSNAYTVQVSLAARNGKPTNLPYQPPLMEGLLLSLTDMPEGEYTVSWFDPQEAQWLETQTIPAQNKTLIIPIPAFREDLAAKITFTR